MEFPFLPNNFVLSTWICIITIICAVAAYYWFASSKSNLHTSPGPTNGEESSSTTESPTALQQHVLFWDRDNDNIIYPQDVYTGFREIGFSVPFSLAALLIPIFFSYPTRLGHSYIPDPLFRIYISSIHKAKHGSDTGIYDLKGNLRVHFFEDMFTEFDALGTRSLGAADLWRMVARNRVAADAAGWSFAAMEWGTTWLLLQRGGRVGMEDLRACYDGSLFWRLREERLKGVDVARGYGWNEFSRDVFEKISRGIGS